MTPEVSVVIPTRNRSELLALTLRTVLQQRDVDLEVVVVDDASDVAVAEDLGEPAGDPRVRLLRHDVAQGVSASRNHGLAVARGEWVAFCDDDDVWAPDKLALQVAAGRKSGRAWVYAGAVKVDGALRTIGGEPPAPPEVVHRRLPGWTLVPGGCSGVLAVREVVVDVGGFDPALVNLADWDLWSRLARVSPPDWVPRPLTGYRIHGGNSSQDTALVLKELDRLDGRYGARVDRGAVHHYLAWVSLRGSRRTRAARHFAAAALRGEVLPVMRSATTLSGSAARAALGRPARPPQHAAWLAQADEWLEPLR